MDQSINIKKSKALLSVKEEAAKALAQTAGNADKNACLCDQRQYVFQSCN